MTEDALDHDAAAEVKGPAIVAKPFILGNLVNAIASLVDGDIASSTEDDQIFVLIVAIVADGALSVLLHDQAALMGAQRVVPLDVKPVRPVVIWIVCSFR